MNKTKTICPICGTINNQLEPGKTDSLIICQKCNSTVKQIHDEKKVRIPVYSMNEIEM